MEEEGIVSESRLCESRQKPQKPYPRFVVKTGVGGWVALAGGGGVGPVFAGLVDLLGYVGRIL